MKNQSKWRTTLEIIKKNKGNWLGHCTLKNVTEGGLKGTLKKVFVDDGSTQLRVSY